MTMYFVGIDISKYRKRSENKPHRVAITHVAKKLVRVIYALESQDIDFDPKKLR